MGAEVDSIKERVSIVDVVGEYVQLRPAGQNLKALCPFHTEKTPSFIVSPKRGTWHCFGSCSEGGDIFTFIQKIEGIEFPDALKLLAERAGIELSSRSDFAKAGTSRRQRLFDVLDSAAALYHQILMQPKAGEKARQYLSGRGLTEETMVAFQLGYAPNTWDLLQRALKRKGFTESELIETGLVGRSQRGKLFDRFRGRIMFPVHDSRARIVAFGGRIAPWHETGNEGKYVNSPETALYEKRFTVYNLHRAKQELRRGSPCVVVEGYMDVAMLVQAGAQNVVATSGTAFTEGHIQQLARYTDTLHFAFDADVAGFKATVAATQAALSAGMNVATVVLPAGKDPADIVKESPAQALTTIQTVQPLLAVLLEQLRHGQTDKQLQLAALVPLLALVKNPIQQGKMIEGVADALHVPADRIIDLVRLSPAPLNAKVSFENTPTPGGPVLAERQLLGIFIAEPDVRQALFSYLDVTLVLDPQCLALYTSMQQLSQLNSTFPSMPPDVFIDALAADQRPFADGVRALAEELLNTGNQTALQEGRTLVRALRRRSLHTLLEQLEHEVAESSDHERLHALERFRALSQELANVDNSVR